MACAAPPQNTRKAEPRQTIEDEDAYAHKVLQEILDGRLDLHGNPWVAPKNPFQEAVEINGKRKESGEPAIDSTEALNLVLRTPMFVWAPEKLAPGLIVRCPTCGTMNSGTRWGPLRVLHNLTGRSIYVSSRHRCGKCRNKSKKSAVEFMADSPEVVATLPVLVQSLWNFQNQSRGHGGHITCTSLSDFIQAHATKQSWEAIANAIDEMKKTAWARDVTLRYLRLCEMLQLVPDEIPAALPGEYRLSAHWIRRHFLSEYFARQGEIEQEIAAETGDNVLALDWTHTAAARCGGGFMFNAMIQNKI